MPVDIAELQVWIGRESHNRDILAATLVRQFNATSDEGAIDLWTTRTGGPPGMVTPASVAARGKRPI